MLLAFTFLFLMSCRSAPLLEAKIASEDSPARLRRASVILLGAIKSERSVPLLADLLRKDQDPEVRRLSARALANYRPSPEARQILIDELVHGDAFDGSYDVVYSLSTFQNASDIALFEQLAAGHEDVSIRTQALHSLGSFNRPDSIPFLAAVATNDPHPDPRFMAAQLIRELER